MTALRQDELAIARQAAEWFDTLIESDPADCAAFSEWIARSPLHVQEFLNVSAVHRLFDKLDPQRRLDVAAMLKDGTAVVMPSVARKEPLTPAPLPQGERGKRRAVWWVAAAAAAMAGASFVAIYEGHRSDRYVTEVGEQRTIELEDGSLVYLNAASGLTAQFDERRRDIELTSGEALFAVQRDSRRPFRVHAGKAVIRALGTQFNVRQSARGTEVAVIEGAVDVTDVARVRASLAAGEAARLDSAGQLVERASSDAARVTAWRQRRLVFESDTLEDIAAEFNRYNRAPKIRIDGDAIGRRRFTGVLDADNPESLLRILTEADDLAFEKEADALVIRAR